MATNYTTKTASLKATIADIRKISAKNIEADKMLVTDTRAGSETFGEKTDVMDILTTMKNGIDIGTKDSSFDSDDDTSGFLKSVSKLNFKGAFVNVIRKDDGTVDLWINPDNNHALASTGVMSGLTTDAKYVFGSSTAAWDLPTTAGSSYANSHIITNDQKITIKGNKNGVVSETVSVANLTSKLRVDVLKKDGSVIVSGSSPYLTLDQMPETKLDTGLTLTYTADGISFSVTDLKRYVEEDAINGWDAAHGFIPDSVSFKAFITVDTSVILGAGNTYSVNVYLDTYDTEGVLQSSTLLHEGSKYFAYTPQQATIGSSLVAEVTTPVYHHVSGVPYYTAGTEITVTTAPVTNATVMAASNATKRATISVTDSYCPASQADTTTVSGTASDNETTTVSSTTKVFKYGMQWATDSNDYDGDGNKTEKTEVPRAITSVKTQLTITQKAHASGDDVSTTIPLSGNFWANPTMDTAKTAYFESEGGDYGRVLGYMDGTTLVVSDSAWDSTQALTGNTNSAYNKQAKISNGTLIHGGVAGESRYYVRKFQYSNAADQCSSFNLKVDGITTLNGSDTSKEVWMFLADDLTNGRRLDLETSRSAANGTKGVGTSLSSGTIKVTNSLVYAQNVPVYIVVKLSTTSAKVASDMIMS